ncbi:MAG: hypothetical protein IJA32_09645 [Lachnospiraceae bacterium]|nr:hypothetical protein [Lachnospiraceae bacterium]
MAMLINNNKNHLERITVSRKNRVSNASISKGNQMKWVKDGKFIKLNTWKWYEEISEVLVSHFLSFTDIDDFVTYHPCIVEEEGKTMGMGCYSFNFLQEGEQDITFYRLLKNMGLDLGCISYDGVRDGVSDIVGFDIKPYLDRCLCLDAMIYNEDRHLNNLSVIRTSDGYREAPIYDNGLACLADVYTYPMDISLEENLSKCYAKTFHTDFLQQIKGHFMKPICIDVDRFFNSILTETPEEERAMEVIKCGLRRTEGLAWERF